MNNVADKLYKLRKENIYLWLFIISILYIGPGLLFWVLQTKLVDRHPLLALLSTGLAETLLLAGFIGIFYEALIRSRFEDQMVDTILKTFEADAGLLKKKRFKDETVNSINN